MTKKENKTADIKKYQRDYRSKNREKLLLLSKNRYKKTAAKNSSLKEKAQILKLEKESLTKKYSYSQYWLIKFSLIKKDKSKSNFKTIIQARSALFAKEILERKIDADSPQVKISNLKIKMFHKNFKLNNKKLSLLNWMDIKNCSFPNELNILFKHHDN